MNLGRRIAGRRDVLVVAAVGVVLAAAGAALLTHGLVESGGPPQPPPVGAVQPDADRSAPPTTPGPGSTPPTTPPSTPPSTPGPQPAFGPVLPDARPISVDIASIGVHAKHLVPLAYTDNGSLEVPKDFDVPGWFTPGPSPGQLGPAVIAGHVDSKAGPAVFYRLGALKAGAVVRVGRSDGTTATFTVDRVARYPKNDFPTAAVYGNTTDRAELRLITCGGDFNHRTGHYRDNIVAFAHLTAVAGSTATGPAAR